MSLEVVRILQYLRFVAPGAFFLIMFPVAILLVWRVTWMFAVKDRERWLSVYGEKAAAAKIRSLEIEVSRLKGVVNRQKGRHRQTIAAIRGVQTHFGKVQEILTLADANSKEESNED